MRANRSFRRFLEELVVGIGTLVRSKRLKEILALAASYGASRVRIFG